jgi:hypothetical protein
MNVLTGLAVLGLIMVGSALVVRTSGIVTPRMQAVEVVESEAQPNEMPLYVEFEPDSWR